MKAIFSILMLLTFAINASGFGKIAQASIFSAPSISVVQSTDVASSTEELDKCCMDKETNEANNFKPRCIADNFIVADATLQSVDSAKEKLLCFSATYRAYVFKAPLIRPPIV